jgi:hypothetical protein
MTETDRDNSAASEVQTDVSDGSNERDPLGFEELASQLTAMPAGGNPGLLGGPGSRYGNASSTDGPEGPIDRSQWRTSYQAFRANIIAQQGADGNLAIEWGELADLRQMNETAEASLRDGSDRNGTNVRQIAERIGEVQWEGQFESLEAPVEGNQEVRFALPPVAAPLKLRFLIDERDADQWSALRTGETVRFAGRLEIAKPGEINVLVRKLD